MKAEREEGLSVQGAAWDGDGDGGSWLVLRTGRIRDEATRKWALALRG